MNSNRASTGTIDVDISPQQLNVVHDMITNNPESLIDNITIPEVHHQSNNSLNQREEQVILPNPNHHAHDSQHQSSNRQIDTMIRMEAFDKSKERGIIVDVHREGDNKCSIDPHQKKAQMDKSKGSDDTSLHFDLHNQHQRNGPSVPPTTISKRTSSSSSGGYSATDDVDYLKWVSETKGQVRHHMNKTISFATDRDLSERQDPNGSKSLNSSTSGVSSVESFPADANNLERKRDHMIKQYPSKTDQKRASSSASTSSGHGSPEDSEMANNILNAKKGSYIVEPNVTNKEVDPKRSTRTSPISTISRVNSSSPDSGYEHQSSSGTFY